MKRVGKRESGGQGYCKKNEINAWGRGVGGAWWIDPSIDGGRSVDGLLVYSSMYVVCRGGMHFGGKPRERVDDEPEQKGWW